MATFRISIGEVEEVEDKYSKDGFDGLRVRAKLEQDDPKHTNDIPWAFPLLPKMIHVLPKKGEAVLVFVEEEHGHVKNSGIRYFLGPIISQNQYRDYSPKEGATSLMMSHKLNPIQKITNYAITNGAFPKQEDVAVVGRGKEDIILKYNDKSSEVDIRAGIRTEPTNSDDPNFFGNIIFNGIDPAYIQLKFKNGIATGQDHAANSVINMVANRINIMSNRDDTISHDLRDQDSLVPDDKMDTIMDNLHQVPKGDELVKLLELMKGAIMHHVHPWAGMEQCGDWAGYINELKKFDIPSILSKYVRIS